MQSNTMCAFVTATLAYIVLFRASARSGACARTRTVVFVGDLLAPA